MAGQGIVVLRLIEFLTGIVLEVMLMSLASFFYVLAFVLFILAAIQVPSGRFNLTAAGLASLSAAGLFGGGSFSFGHG